MSIATAAQKVADAIALLRAIGTPPDPLPAMPTIYVRPLNMQRITMLHIQWALGERYDRWQDPLIMSPGAISLDFSTRQSGGGQLPFQYSRYGIRMHDMSMRNGRIVAVGGALGATGGKVVGTWADEPHGLYVAELVALDSLGNAIPSPLESLGVFPVYLNRDNVPFSHYWITNGTHDWDRGKPWHAWVAVPLSAIDADRHIPLPVVKAKPYRNAAGEIVMPPNGRIYRTAMVPTGEANNMTDHRPCKTLKGFTVADNRQGYFPSDVFAPFPKWPLLSGKRGTATCYSPFSVKPGRAQKGFFTGPWGWYLMQADGSVETLFGIEHDQAYYWRELSLTHPGVRYAGIVDDPTAPRKFPRWAWHWDFDDKTTVTDPTKPQIGGEDQHPGAVKAYLPDADGWIWETSRADRTSPVHVTRRLVGQLRGAFACLLRRGTRELYVTEIHGHRISVWDVDTWQFIRYEVDSPEAYKYGATSGSVQLFNYFAGHDMTTARASVCVGPQDLAEVDGMLLWTSFAQGQVLSKPFGAPASATRVVCRPTIVRSSVGSHFITLAVTDNSVVDSEGNMPRGGFGKHGSVWTLTFHNQQFGRPQLFEPTASGLYSERDWLTVNGAPFTYNKVQGIGPWSNDVYPTGLGVGHNQLWTGGTLNGMNTYRWAEPNEVAPNEAKLSRGHDDYIKRGQDLLHGLYANGYTRYPLPKGEHPDKDYFFQQQGR